MEETPEQQAERLRQSNRTQAVRNAFDRVDDYPWHSPDDTFALLDLDAVEVTDDGVVDEVAVRRLVRQIAQKRPWLVNSDDPDAPARLPHGASGAAVGSGRRRVDDGRFTEAQIKERFPALRNHR